MFFFQAEDGIRDLTVTGVQTCALPISGVTGSGKSTALAAMINHINTNRRGNIITIEDPIEFLHRDNLANISQREVGDDTPSFHTAFRHALRHGARAVPERPDSHPRRQGHTYSHSAF